MATSVVMASEEANTRRSGSEKNHGGFGVSSRPEKAKEGGGRRKPKVNDDGHAQQKMKKKPQRGMGVAQLERLRMQEITTTTTTTNNNNNHPSPLLHYSLNLRATLPQDRYFLPSSFPDPMLQTAVPAKFVGNASSYGPMMNIGGVVGQSGLNHNLLINHQGIGKGGFSGGGLVGGVYGTTVNGDGGTDLYGLGGASSTRWCSQAAAGNVVGETSKELSSIPNTNKYFSDHHCDLCHKKKKPLGDLYGNAYQINNGSGFLGLNLGGNQNIDSTTSGSGYGFGAGNEDQFNFQNGGLVGVQRKGGSVFMEYEFFPAGKGGSGTCSKEVEEAELLELGSSSSSSEASVVAVAGAAVGRGEAPNCFTTTATTTTCTGFDASNSVDLSLKLSY